MECNFNASRFIVSNHEVRTSVLSACKYVITIYICIYGRGDNGSSLNRIEEGRLHLSEIIRRAIFSMSLHYEGNKQMVIKRLERKSGIL